MSNPLYHEKPRKWNWLDWLVLLVVVAIAVVVVLLSFSNTAKLARQLGLNAILTAGLVEALFASLLLIRSKQRATQRNVPLFLSAGYFTSLGFVTAVNMWGLAQENPVIGPVVGAAISGAMWLMENVLVWLAVDSHKPHKKTIREIKREVMREIKEEKAIQWLEWRRWEARKPDLDLIREARRAEQERKQVEADGLPEFFTQQPETTPQIEAEPVVIVQETQKEPETAEVIPIRRPIGFHVDGTFTEQVNNRTEQAAEQTVNKRTTRANKTEQTANKNKRTNGVSKQRTSGVNKTEQAYIYAMALIEQNKPFTVRSVAEAVGCGVATAQKAINKARADFKAE